MGCGAPHQNATENDCSVNRHFRHDQVDDFRMASPPTS